MGKFKGYAVVIAEMINGELIVATDEYTNYDAAKTAFIAAKSRKVVCVDLVDSNDDIVAEYPGS